MLSWSRPDPLTRDLIHLINARRHDHGDTDAAIDTLQAFIEQGREQDLLTVLAALDEEMAEWMFDLVAEASCAVIMDGPDEEKNAYALMAALELPLQANLGQPLGLKIDPVATADLLHRHLQLPAGVVVRVEPRLLTDATLAFSRSLRCVHGRRRWWHGFVEILIGELQIRFGLTCEREMPVRPLTAERRNPH